MLPTTTRVTSRDSERGQVSEQRGASPAARADHNGADVSAGGGYRWTYSVLHLLGQRGGPGPQVRRLSPTAPTPPPQLQLELQFQRPRDPHRELVMRITSL